MLLIYTFDKNELRNTDFLDEVMRIDFGQAQPKGTRVKLRMLSTSSDSEGFQTHLSFPDLLPGEIEEHIGDYTDAWELGGFLFQSEHGVSRGNSGAGADYGRYTAHMSTIPLDIDLGRIDHNKQCFTVIVNARRMNPDVNRNTLSNIQVVLEMFHDSVST